MKIAILVSHFPPEWIGGTEISTYNLAKQLAKRGHEVHVITRMQSPSQRYEKKDGFHVHRVWYLNCSVLKFTYYITSLFETLKINADIIHGQMIFPNGLIALIAGRLTNKPSVGYERGPTYLRSRIFTHTIERFILRRLDAVIALTDDMKNLLQQISNRNDIIVIPNGIDVSCFNIDREACRGKIGQQNSKLILFVGHLNKVKGTSFLITAMQSISNRIQEVKLIVIGEGEDEEKMRELANNLGIADKIDFIEKVPNADIPIYMKAADVLVLPSLSEGFPVTILEAMAAGLPIVASNVCGIAEIIKDDENGFLVTPANSSDIAKKVINLLTDREKMGKMKQNNKEKAKDYDWDTIVRQLETVYLSVQKGDLE